MRQANPPTVRADHRYWLGMIFPALLCASVLVILVPLPAMLLDLLLAANLTISVLVLLTAVSVGRPLEFSTFPSLLLATTLMRLVLNVASTRLVLTRGAIDGELAAGGVIRAFGEFVAGGQIIVGIVLFAIILAIQFMVITKGATRISEVAARFALDGMPGRQMAIDADLSAGHITLDQARQRRDEVAQQADFYGAMDGAGKFVRGDAVAGLLITCINITGGLAIGVLQYQMAPLEALEIFTKLTIGDGLVSQVPAFLISLAAGILVTRSSSPSELSQDVVAQIFHRPEALGISAVFLAGLSLTGLPPIPLLTIAGFLGILAWRFSQVSPDVSEINNTPPAVTSTSSEPDFASQLTVHPIELEMGFGLIRLTDPNLGGDLLERINRIRQKLAQELGLIIPGVRFRDNLRLRQAQYRIRLHDVPVATGDAYPDRCLAVNLGNVSADIQGIRGLDPALQKPAVWIETADRESAIEHGYHLVETTQVVTTHLCEIIRQHAEELLSQQQVHLLLDRLGKHSPRVVSELVPGVLKVAQVHQVLVRLLREKVPIRQLESILEILANHASQTHDISRLTEAVRWGLRRTICQQHRDARGTLRVIALAADLEEDLLAVSAAESSTESAQIPVRYVEILAHTLSEELSELKTAGFPAVVLCRTALRSLLSQQLGPRLPDAIFLSTQEITPDTQLRIHNQVSRFRIRDEEVAFA